MLLSVAHLGNGQIFVYKNRSFFKSGYNMFQE